MVNWKRDIEYLEFGSSVFSNSGKWDIRKTAAANKGVFRLSYFQLALCTAKSVISRGHKFSPKVAAFARSYLNTIPFLLDEKGGFLAINNDNQIFLRDFSKSARHGEIAQGINYLFAKKHFGAYAVYDFHFYAQNRKNIAKRCTGRTPDYILCYPGGTIGILESKGTIAANPTKYLVSAHEQCENGKDYLKKNGVGVCNAYASAVSFATSPSEMKRNTCIYIADPESEEPFRDDNFEKNSLYEYSKWFYLAGNRIVAEKLMAGNPLSRQDFEFFEKRAFGESTIVGSWSMELPIENEKANGRMEGLRTVKVSLGITPFLQECLMEGRTFECRDKLEAMKAVVQITYEPNIIEVFDDGTFIKID